MYVRTIRHPDRPEVEFRFSTVTDPLGSVNTVSMTEDTLAAFGGRIQRAVKWLVRYLETGITRMDDLD